MSTIGYLYVQMFWFSFYFFSLQVFPQSGRKNESLFLWSTMQMRLGSLSSRKKNWWKSNSNLNLLNNSQHLLWWPYRYKNETKKKIMHRRHRNLNNNIFACTLHSHATITSHKLQSLPNYNKNNDDEKSLFWVWKCTFSRF